MNQQLNIVNNNKQEIAGYQNINVNELNNIVNGYIDQIVCDCLDELSFDSRNIVTREIINKLSFDGTATFRFINATVLSNRILKNELDSQKLSSFIPNVQSLWTEYYIIEMFNSIPNIYIEKYYIENIYTVISINKKA